MTELVQLQLPEHGRPVPGDHVDVERLEAELADVVEGDVRFDRGTRAAYATDASNYRQPPLGVVMPRSKDDVVRAVEVCRSHGAPVLGRGGGTSLAGQCCNVAVVFDFTRHMNEVLHVDAERRIARVQPGCVLDDLRDVARAHGLTFGPDPSTHDRCAIGGMMGNNACGVHSVHAQWHTGPRTSDNVHRVEVLTYDGARFWAGETPDDELEEIVEAGGRRGEIYRALRELRDDVGDRVREEFPDIPRRVSGYNLDELLPDRGFHVGRALVGTESTCALYLEAEVHLIPEPGDRVLLVLGYPDVYRAADHVVRIMEHEPIGLEGLDERLIQYMELKGFRTEDIGLLPAGDAYLLVEIGGEDRDDARRKAERLKEALESGGDAPSCEIVDDPEDEAHIWEVREAGLGATAFVPGQPSTWPGWEDTAVHPRDLGAYLRDFRGLLESYDYECAFYGHFGQGLLHTRIDFDLETHEGLRTYMRFSEDCSDLVARYGGSLSGEHGDGQSRGALLSKMYGPEVIDGFRRFKRIWDPKGMMNPGKSVDAYLPDQNLVLGTDWTPPVFDDQRYGYPTDDFAFHNAPLRCVGVGKCRRKGGGTMCPSYMVTREEEHSTRGRARILYEMLRGDVITDGWKSEDVHDALDLCLSCKGCKSDCPVDVDMATYKSEFLSHYYEGRLRPRHAYALGLIHRWARLGAPVAGLANRLMDVGPIERLMKWAADIHPARELPRLSKPTFRRRFQREWASVNPGARRVIYWADTFNNYFHADTAMAGARVLDALGFHVDVPGRPLCCGRPLYDFGWVDRAKKLWTDILDHLEDDIEQGIPVVGVEPSCVAAFRDELPMLFPHDKRAERLASQTFLLAEFIEKHAPGVELPRVGGEVLLHGHCHQKAVLDFGADRRVLERMGVDVRVPDSGCCGMAGPFGFEKAHYDVAQACAERVLLREVRERDRGTPVLTDGFSCREMIRQNEPVRALNLAEFVWRAIEEAGGIESIGPARGPGARGGGRDRRPGIGTESGRT